MSQIMNKIIDWIVNFFKEEPPKRIEKDENLFQADNMNLNNEIKRLQELESMVNQLVGDNKKLQQKVESLEKQIVELKANLEHVIWEIKQENEDNNPEPPKEASETSDWIYFGAPENGCFKSASQKNKEESNIYYRINAKSLEIEYIHSGLDSRILSYRNEWLLPICDFINNVASASSIKMEQSGKVIKHGEDYVIDPENKIKIKLL